MYLYAYFIGNPIDCIHVVTYHAGAVMACAGADNLIRVVDRASGKVCMLAYNCIGLFH